MAQTMICLTVRPLVAIPAWHNLHTVSNGWDILDPPDSSNVFCEKIDRAHLDYADLDK